MGYSVLLIDDEKTTREGLRMVIDAMGDGFQVIGEAGDGQEGIRLAEELRPSLIISDVRMPRMNGLDFAERVRSFDRLAEIIFISGFSDKEYLQKAIKLHAFEYLEKPLSPDKIMKTLREAASNYRAKVERSLREHSDFIYRLYRELPVDDAAMDRFSRDFGPEAGKTFHYRSGMVRRGPWSLSPGDMNRRLSAFFPEADVLTASAERDLLFLMISRQRLSPESVMSAEETLLGGDDTTSVIFGPMTMIIPDLSQAFLVLRGFYFLPFYRGWGRVYPYDPRLNRPGGEPAPLPREEVAASVKTGDFDRARALWEDFFQSAAEPPYADPETLVGEVSACLEETASSLSRLCPVPEPEETLRDLSHLEEYVRAVMEDFRVFYDQSSGSSRHVAMVKELILSRLSSPLSLSELADQLHLSESYLSRIFKEECGVGIHGYISSLRVERAASLLEKTTLPLQKIAMNVGFSSSDHFSRVFKRSKGVSPSEYRNRL